MKTLIKNTADIALSLSINSLLESGLIEQIIVAIVITLFNTCIIPLFKKLWNKLSKKSQDQIKNELDKIKEELDKKDGDDNGNNSN